MSTETSFPSTWFKVPYLTARHVAEVYTGITYFVNVPDYKKPRNYYKRQSDDIKDFSNKSRVRALQKLTMIDPTKLHVPHFVTLTYHNNFPTDAESIKSDLDAFLKRLMRAAPDLYYFWRVELQKRGAPHFHLILWVSRSRPPYSVGYLVNLMRKIWTAFNRCNCSYCRTNAVRVDLVDDSRKAYYYTAKYLSKSSPLANDLKLGRIWGCSRNLPISQKALFTGSTDFVTVLQYASVLWSMQYTLSNPFYLATLFSRPSGFLFIPSVVVRELANQILSGSPDPVNDASKVLNYPRKRSLDDLRNSPIAGIPAGASVSRASVSAGPPAHENDLSYALEAAAIVNDYSARYLSGYSRP